MQLSAQYLKKRYDKALDRMYHIRVKGEVRSSSHDMARELEAATIGSQAVGAMLVLSGMSGVGKSTIGAVLQSHGYEKLRNTYTRPRRPDETDDDGIFINEHTFKQWQKEGRFATTNRTNGAMHGVLHSELAKASRHQKVWADKSVKSMRQLTPYIRARLIYVLPDSFDILLSRLIARETSAGRAGMSRRQIYARLDEEIDELLCSLSLPYEYIVNDTLQRVEDKLRAEYIDKT